MLELRTIEQEQADMAKTQTRAKWINELCDTGQHQLLRYT